MAAAAADENPLGLPPLSNAAPAPASHFQEPVRSWVRPARSRPSGQPGAGGGFQWPAWLAGGADSLLYKVGAAAFVIALFGVLIYLRWDRPSRTQRLGEAIDAAFIAPSPQASSTPPPTPTPPPAPKPLATPPALSFKKERQWTEGTAVVTDRQARTTRVRLLLPPGEHSAASLPCVFVAPAGSNLLTGVAFDRDEHLDYIPLLARGMAVCLYSLDGTVRDQFANNDLLVGMAAGHYADADGGLKNLADAIDTVLASAPMVDAKRLATAGHSSAGTIAVAAVGREPRIVAAAAFAPAIDLPARFKDEIEALSGPLTRMVYRLSPSELPSLNGPVFIRHCRDDDNTPLAHAEAFAAKHGSKVTLDVQPTGGHVGAFTAGTAAGFDFLAKHFDAKPVATPTTRRSRG
jgi:dienelactone hydrolase